MSDNENLSLNFSCIPTYILDNLKEKILEISKNITKTKPGSLNYLLFGEQISKQSINIKLGKPIGENFPKDLINSTKHLTLEKSGCLQLHNSNKKKDFDLI